MEEINIKELLDYFKSKLIFIIFIVSIVTSLGVIYKLLIEQPIYQSSTSLILTGFTGSNENDSTINNNDITINQKLLTTYQQITKSRKVLSQVISELNLNYSVEELANNVSVTGVTDTEIIKITVSDPNADQAYYIVKNIANVFSDEIRNIYNVSNVSILDVPEVAESPSNMGFLKSLLLYAGVGAILAILIVLVIYYFDTTIKTVEQIEARIDVPVLGSVLDYNANKKRGKK